MVAVVFVAQMGAMEQLILAAVVVGCVTLALQAQAVVELLLLRTPAQWQGLLGVI
jgi:hypothetical protein